MEPSLPHRIWKAFTRVLVIIAFLLILTMALSVIFYDAAARTGWVIPSPFADVMMLFLNFYRDVCEAFVAFVYNLPLIGHGG